MTTRIEPRLAEALDWAWSAPVPARVEARARELVLDTLGCALAASAKPPLRVLAGQLSASDPGSARVPGFDASMSAGGAALLFAAAACWDEACEGLARAHGRPGVPVLAACLGLGQVRAATFGQVLDALEAGYEIGGRLGEALRIAPGMHVDGAWSSLGAAAAAVRLCGGSAPQALEAVRIAACQLPYSLYRPVAQGSEARNTYLGHSAQLGLLAANAALSGVRGPEGVLDEVASRPLIAGTVAPPGEWLVLQGYFKRYAAVRHVHYGVAAALALRPRLAGRLDRVERLRLSVYAEALTYCANRAPSLPIQAQFSLAYGVARALVAGDLAPDAYSPAALSDPAVRALERKIELSESAELTRAGTRGARLAVELAGEALEAAADDAALAMDREALLAKFARYAGSSRAAGLRVLEAPRTQRWTEVLRLAASPA